MVEQAKECVGTLSADVTGLDSSFVSTMFDKQFFLHVVFFFAFIPHSSHRIENEKVSDFGQLKSMNHKCYMYESSQPNKIYNNMTKIECFM